MKTIVLKNAGGSIRAEAKVDIFASLAELNTIGFDTRFTGMTIVEDDASIIGGANIDEKEYSWQDIRNIAAATTPDLELWVFDLNPLDGGAGSVQITL